MDISLQISGLDMINLGNNPQPWWRDTDYVLKIINCFQQAGLWQGFRYCLDLHEDVINPFDSIEDLIELSRFWELEKTYLFMQEEDSTDYMAHWMLNSGGIYIESPNSLSLYLNIQKNYLQHQNIELEQLIDFVIRLHSAFSDTAIFGPVARIAVERISYPRVLPPRLLEEDFAPSLVNFFSKRYLAGSSRWETAHKENLLSLPMPPGCSRIEQGDLIVLRWADNLHDKEHISQRLGLQDEWFVEAVEPEIHPRFEPNGDTVADWVLKMNPDRFLTLYYPYGDIGYGYKAIVLNEQNQLDPQTMSQLQQWLEAGQLPDGRNLSGVSLILPSRNAAVRAREQLSGLKNFGAVYYVDNQMLLWRLYPYATSDFLESEPETTIPEEFINWLSPPPPPLTPSSSWMEEQKQYLPREQEWDAEQREFVEEIFAYFQLESLEWLSDTDPITDPLQLSLPQDIEQPIHEILHEYRDKEEWYYNIKISPSWKTFKFYSACTEGVPDPSENQVWLLAEFFSRVNWEIKFGSLELDYEELGCWDIRYKTTIECMGCPIDRALIRNIVRNNVISLEKYLPVIRAVIQQDVSPAVAASWLNLPSRQGVYCPMSEEEKQEDANTRKVLQQLRDEGILRGWDLNQIEELSGIILEMDYIGYEGQFKCQLQVKNKQREFLCYALYPQVVPPSKLLVLAELFARMNPGIGNFDLDWDSGKMRYRISIDFHGSQFNPVLAIRQAYICASEMDEELPLFRLVIEEDVPPTEALAQFYDYSDEDEEFDEDYDDFEEQESFDDN